jgi:hypothetical protein
LASRGISRGGKSKHECRRKCGLEDTGHGLNSLQTCEGTPIGPFVSKPKALITVC